MLLEAQIEEALAQAALDLWRATGEDPFARLAAQPPILVAESTRMALAGSPLSRFALAAAFATPVPRERSEDGFLALARARAAIATRLGFADVWALAMACHGESPLPALTADFDPGAVSVTVTRADAPVPGRTFVIAPGRDVRVRVWERPAALPEGTLRAKLHELGHAFHACVDTGHPARAIEEGVAAWFAAQMEQPAFVREVLRLPDADAIAEAERATRAARRARLEAAAAAERAFYTEGGPPPWREPLAWTDPGASAVYAAAESVRDALDDAHGASWPARPLGMLLAR